MLRDRVSSIGPDLKEFDTSLTTKGLPELLYSVIHTIIELAMLGFGLPIFE